MNKRPTKIVLRIHVVRVPPRERDQALTTRWEKFLRRKPRVVADGYESE